jgi:predicted RNA-binding Zn ribbon-like protein
MADHDEPEAVALITAFVNTRDVMSGSEALSGADGLEGWLREQGLLGWGTEVSDGDADVARELREALRDVLVGRHGGAAPAEATARFEAVAGRFPLRVSMHHGPPGLVPVSTGVRGALGSVVAAVAATATSEQWSRLKACLADDCRWAFYDTSRNRSRTWCSMESCGNRTKTRAYRARQRSARSSPAAAGEDGPRA